MFDLRRLSTPASPGQRPFGMQQDNSLPISLTKSVLGIAPAFGDPYFRNRHHNLCDARQATRICISGVYNHW